MPTQRPKFALLAALCAALCALQPRATAQTERAPLLDHAHLRRDLTRFASEHSGLVTRLELGSSRRELKIDALRLAAGELGRGRPAILVVANLDGPLVYTSGIALEVARDLAQRYSTDARVKELLDTTTVYVVPRANPDGAEPRFKTPTVEKWGTGFDVDNDRDGRVGEDHAGDVDKDGYVAWMRQRDPEGEWIVDPTDPRAMRKADPTRGERGEWKLMQEGRDRDGDGKVAEDPARDAEVNRNFPAGWQEHSARAGLYPTGEPETRALCEFVMGHEDIQLVIVYGRQDNLAEGAEVRSR